jgi:D-alanyl-D-alanine carboxypeptidase (penicillin-binding protein 5/6)
MKRMTGPVSALAAIAAAVALALFFHTPGQLEPSEPIAEISLPEPTMAILPPLSLNSDNAILMVLNENRDVLLDMSSDERVYPASLTKIMTAVVALENASDLSEPVTLGQWIFDETFTRNASVAGFLPGESVGIEDLLYGLILPSGGECAIGLAAHIAGSEAAFAELMNRKAAVLGMNGSRFTNSAGLHDPEQYATVRDIAVLLDYALKNETFHTIFTSRSHVVSGTNRHPDGLTFHSTVFSKTDGEYADFRLLGAKTGYTPEAGQCLAGLAEKDGELYILVTAGAPVESNLTETLHIDDAVVVFSAIE